MSIGMRFRPLFLLLTALPWAAAHADIEPSGCAELEHATISWIVPTNPGGGYDAYSRLLQPFLEKQLNVRIRIENMPQAGGIVAAQALRNAAPDGRTLGLVNASGLLAARAVEENLVPDPGIDFTVLAHVVSNQMVLFAGADSGFTDMQDLFRVGQSRPIVFGVRDLGSTSFYSVPVTTSLLGLEYALVSGYVGTAARAMAILRGEVDIIVGNFDSLRSQVIAGELIPLLLLSGVTEGVPGIPALGGPDGMAQIRAAATGRTPRQAEQEAGDLAVIVGAGRLVVAPPGLPARLSDCLENALGDILRQAEFLQAAERAQLSIEYKDSKTAGQALLAGTRAVRRFRPLISAAIAQARE